MPYLPVSLQINVNVYILCSHFTLNYVLLALCRVNFVLYDCMK